MTPFLSSGDLQHQKAAVSAQRLVLYREATSRHSDSSSGGSKLPKPKIASLIPANACSSSVAIACNWVFHGV